LCTRAWGQNVDCVTGAAGAVSDFIDAYNDFQGSHYGDVAQDLVHGMKSFQSTLKACKKQNWCATNPDPTQPDLPQKRPRPAETPRTSGSGTVAHQTQSGRR
jgi:hypothetical protein